MKKAIVRRGTIGTKIIILLILSIIISSLSIGIFSYLSYKGNSLKINGEKALSIAHSIASSIDGDQFEQYQKTGTVDGYYNQVRDMMSEIKQRNNLTYVYSLVDSGSDYKYIISGYSEGEDQTTWGYLGYADPKDIFAAETSLVFEDGTGRYTEPQDYGEGYGILVSGFAPILSSSGDIVGIVGIDLSVSETIAEVNKIIPVIALMILVTGARQKEITKNSGAASIFASLPLTGLSQTRTCYRSRRWREILKPERTRNCMRVISERSLKASTPHWTPSSIRFSGMNSCLTRCLSRCR